MTRIDMETTIRALIDAQSAMDRIALGGLMRDPREGETLAGYVADALAADKSALVDKATRARVAIAEARIAVQAAFGAIGLRPA